MATLPMELYDTMSTRGRRGTGSTAKRSWLCQFHDRYGTWAPQKGISRFTDGLAAGSYPAEESRLICVGVDREGKGPGYSYGGVVYPFYTCVVTAHYSDIQAYDQVREGWSGQPRLLEVGRGRRLIDGRVLDIPVHRSCPQSTWTLTRFFVHHPSRRQGLSAKQGLVNRFAWNGFGRETVRFEHADVETYYDDQLDRIMDKVTFHFVHDAFGHNCVPDGYGWIPLLDKIYPTGNLATLLTGGW